MLILIRGERCVVGSLTAGMVLAVAICQSVATAQTNPPVGSPTPAQSDVEPPSLTRLRNETRHLLRQQAIADQGPSADVAVTALCDLYVILRSDPRYPNSDTLQSDAVKIRRRLIRVATKRRQALERQGIARPGNLAQTVDAAIKRATEQAARDSLSTGASRMPANQSDDQPDHTQNRDPTSNAPRGASGGAPMDQGWQLVELIQRVIAPDFWDRQGGPGSIHYFAMRRVLVVRATSDVHERIKDLLIALR